jgi:hypothetical protein
MTEFAFILGNGETRRKISEAAKGRKYSAETIEKRAKDLPKNVHIVAKQVQ